MGEFERLSGIVDLFYDAAFDPTLWPEALERYAGAVNGVGAVLVPFLSPTSMMGFASPQMREAAEAYVKDWAGQDSFVEMAVAQNITRGAFSDTDILSPDRIASDPFYQDFRRPFGLGHAAGVLTNPQPDAVVAVSVQLPVGRDPATPQELELLAMLGRHASRSLSLNLRLEGMQIIQDGLAEALSRMACGAAVLDPAGRVIFTNNAFPRGPDAPLRVTNRSLWAALPAEQKALDALLAGARHPLLAAQGPDFVMLSRPNGGRPLLVRAQPVPVSLARGLSPHAGRAPSSVLVLTLDLAIERQVSCALLLQRLGLTPAEARVAERVGRGLSPRETAEEIGIRENTARALLKIAYAKLNISRQSMMARLVAKLSLLADDAEADEQA